MPTVLYIMGWRFFFYANEGNEPIHIHCRKAEKECKYWLDIENFEVEEAYSHSMNNKDKRQVKRLIFAYSIEVTVHGPDGLLDRYHSSRWGDTSVHVNLWRYR